MKRLARIVAAGITLSIPCVRPLGAAEPSQVPVPPPGEVLKTLVKQHPRLLATAADFERVRKEMGSDPLLKKWHGNLQTQGAKILTEPPSKYEIPDGKRLLATSRRVLDRICVLAALYRLDGDRRYAERAWLELETAANFKDWNPSHFLDTAELTCAFAIGYDWLYDFWTPQQRVTLQTAMVEKGIKPAMKIEEEHGWWARSSFNWNQVCNGGIGMGALALADVEPDLAGRFLSAAMKSIQLAMVEYGPDGAWGEGPGYWAYATKYNVFFLSALQTALGSDFGLAKIPGFSEAGTFPIYASGATGLSFDYADSHANVIRESAMFWLARQFHRPEYAAYETQVTKGGALDMLWYDPALMAKPAAPPPLDKYYRHSELALMRSAWDDRNALYAGFKAGDNKTNHSHLDLGSFIFDALGVRWAADIGADDYNIPAYFGKKRWTYYRLRAEGHNTLVINPGLDPDQDPTAAAQIVRFESTPGRVFAIADLSAAYARDAASVRRGVAMLDRRQLLIQDEVETKAPAELWWFLHTEADVQIGKDGVTATLTKDGEHLLARIISPANAVFKVMKAEPLPGAPHPGQNGNNDKFRKLAIELRDVKDLRLVVLLTPLKQGETEPVKMPDVQPLDKW